MDPEFGQDGWSDPDTPDGEDGWIPDDAEAPWSTADHLGTDDPSRLLEEDAGGEPDPAPVGYAGEESDPVAGDAVDSFGAAGDERATGEVPAEAGESPDPAVGHAAPVSFVGVDLDLPAAEYPDLGADDLFPDGPPVDEAVDGPPWVDAGLLGIDSVGAAAGPHDTSGVVPGPGVTPEAALDDLRALHGDEPGPGPAAGDWARLEASDDPAVRSLARLWNPSATI